MAAALPERLPVTPKAAVGEGVHGFIRRLAAANGHLMLDTFLHALGFHGGIGPMSAEAAWIRLAAAAGADRVNVQAMRWVPDALALGRPMLSVLGSSMAAAFAHPGGMRFCPVCLRNDGVRLDFWSLAYVVACPTHAVLLADACPECHKTFTSKVRGSPSACECGLRFDEVRARSAPEAAVRVARHLAAILGPPTGIEDKDGWSPRWPEAFAGIGASDCMAYLELLGIAATMPAAEDVAKQPRGSRYNAGMASQLLGVAATVDRIEAALRIMEDWPITFVTLLRTIQARGDPLETGDPRLAFSTTIGRTLRRPTRGADGLPLPLIHVAVDTYLKAARQVRGRKRNLTVRNATARRLHTHFNCTDLAIAVGDTQGRRLHRRVLQRTLQGLTSAEASMEAGALAELVRSRATAMHGASLDLISGHAAMGLLEGIQGKGTLSGWEHPRLLPREIALEGLRFAGSPVYRRLAVEVILARLRAAARRLDATVGLIPLLPDAIRLAPLRTWYGKADLLTDIFDGIIGISTTSDCPKIRDLFVDLGRLRTHIRSRDPALPGSPPEFAPLATVNDLIGARIGTCAVLTLDEVRRLVRAHLVGVVLRRSVALNRARPVVERLYRIEDLVGIAERRTGQGTQTEHERSAFGVAHDIGDRVGALRRNGNSLRASARALVRLGLRTTTGASWSHSNLSTAITRAGPLGAMIAIGPYLP